MGRFATVRTALLSAIVIGSLVSLPTAASTVPEAKPPRPTPKPDALIAKGLTGVSIGDGIYNATGVDQALGGAAKAGKRLTFRITIQNDGNASGPFRVQADGASAGFGVTYLSGTLDVTGEVVAGTFTLGRLDPGQTAELIAKVKVKASASIGASTSRLVTITGPTNDVVKFTAKRR